MAETKNLCAQVPVDLHRKISEAREQAGQTTAQYITALITEYFKMKEIGGNEAMANGKSRTLAFQVNEEFFERIKAHLERESARTGRRLTQDYQDVKNLYTGRTEQAQEAIDRLRAEMELVTNNSSSRLRWTQHFKEFSAMTTLDRRAVIAMVQSIRVEGKTDLVITFRYHIEYVKVLKRLDQMGKLPPDLRDVLDTLVAAEKEAA